MTGAICLMGPASPRDLSMHFEGAMRERASTIAGYRGVPVSDLASALVKAGYEVDIVTLASDVEGPVEIRGDRLRMFVAPQRARSIARVHDVFRQERLAMCRLLEKSDALVVHAHWTYEFAMAAIASDRPTVITAHDAPWSVVRHMPTPYRAIRAAMAQYVCGRTPRLVAVSPYLAAVWRRQMHFRGDLVVIPNIAVLPARLPNRTWSTFPPAKLLSVGSASALKNVKNLLLARQILAERGLRLSLELVGPGLHAGGPIARWAQRRRLDLGVVFSGVLDREDLDAAYGRADLLVHPSRLESSGLVLVEAIARGVPVVAGQDSGAVAWTVGGSAGAFLVDVRRSESIAQGIAGCLQDMSAAFERCRVAFSVTAERASADAVVARYMEEYSRACSAMSGN